jgi:hypothetical protein
MTGVSASSAATHRATVTSVAIAWALVCAILLLTGWPRIMAGQLPDPDDALRLVQLRDLIAGQGWFDLTQHRIDPPGGTPMHWSRLVDVPLWLVAAPLGETAALVIVPLLTLGALIWAVGALAARRLGRDVVLYACLMCGFMPALVAQIQPLRIDHHGWQAVCVALALLALSHRTAQRGGACAGLAMAAGLTISLELLPMAAAFAAVLAWRWWRDTRLAGWLTSYLQALAGGLIALFVLTRGMGVWASWCDAISLPHLAFFVVAALGATIAQRLRLIAIPWILTLGLSGAAGLAMVWLWSPQCLSPPFANLDPLVRDYWYVHISEGQPLWRVPWDRAVPALVPLLAGLAACLRLWQRAPDHERAGWAEHGALLIAAVVLGLFVSRSLAFAAVIAAVPLGWLLARMLRTLRQPALGTKVLAVLAIVLMLAPSAPFLLAARFMPTASQPAPVKLTDAACDVQARAQSLGQLPPGVVFAPLDLGPSILLESRHAVVATSHHRAEAAMADVIGAFIAPPEAARAIVATYQADYLALCTDLAEARLYAARHPEGLAAALTRGQTVAWLEPLPALSTDAFKVYRITPGGTAAPRR